MKSLILFLLVICFCTFPVYAYDYTTNESAYDAVVLRLQQYGICNNIKDEFGFGYKATRRDCLNLLYNAVLHMTDNNLKTKPTDLELIEFALNYNLLSEIEVDHFTLDEPIPWNESITLTERLLVSNAGLVNMYPESFDSEEWFDFAQQNLLFGVKSANFSGAYVSLSEKNEPTDIYRYFVILNAAIHTPYISESEDYCYSLVGDFYGVDAQPYKVLDALVSKKGFDIPNGMLTRKEALYALYSTADEMIKDVAMVEEAKTKKGFLDFPDNNDDAYLVANAIRENVLFGKVSGDGQLYLALDERITWKEALLFLERYYLQKCVSTDIELIHSYLLNKNDSWYEQGVSLGIITNNVFFTRGIWIDKEKSDESVEKNKYLCCLYSALHLPTEYYDYSPRFSGHRIDLLMDTRD